MIKEINELWFKSKPLIERTLKEANNLETDYDSYFKILKLILCTFNEVITSEKIYVPLFNTKITTIDYGEYQGTLILTFVEDTYQPTINETYYTYVEYGSCSGCDTLQHILYCYEDKEQQIKDLISLCLHMVEHIKCFGQKE